MAKKDKKDKNSNENTPETNSNEASSNENFIEPEKISEPKKENKPVQQVIADVTPKLAFTKALAANGGKFILVSKGVQIATHLTNPKIIVFDTYFEVNGIRYSFNGIEIKHI